MTRWDVVNEFEAWAAVSAKLIGKSDDERQRLLAEWELTRVWHNANDAWARALASDIVDMRLERPQRYAEICAQVLSHGGEHDTDVGELSLSDDPSLETTHRMRAHSGAPEHASSPIPQGDNLATTPST